MAATAAMTHRHDVTDLRLAVDEAMGTTRSPSPGWRLRSFARNMSWSPPRKKRTSSDSTPGRPEAPLPWFLRQSKAVRGQAFIDLEWQQRNRLMIGSTATDLSSRWARTNTLPDTAPRDRYVNIQPFAQNRIKLQVGHGENDYINASPIVLGNRRYISTQGPKENSVTHFYRMLASETSSVAVVVMLTQTHEAGREKCFNYWPSHRDSLPLELHGDEHESDSPQDGSAPPQLPTPMRFEGTVSPISSDKDMDSRTVVSHLRLRTRDKSAFGASLGSWQTKDIYHLHFTGWSDFSVPEGEDRAALLALLRLSRRLNARAPAPDHLNPPSSASCKESTASIWGHADGNELNPRIVHCSAGVGRSGTFIALDYLLAQLEEGNLDNVPDGVDPIADTVDRLRQQRMMMVQGESQFHFLYDILGELWIERWQQTRQGRGRGFGSDGRPSDRRGRS